MKRATTRDLPSVTSPPLPLQQVMDQHTTKEKANLKVKIPEIERTLELVHHLVAQKVRAPERVRGALRAKRELE